MLDGRTWLDLQEQAYQRILAHYRIERRYGGSPADALRRVLGAWTAVVIDYQASGLTAPPMAGMCWQVANAAVLSVEDRPAYWVRAGR